MPKLKVGEIPRVRLSTARRVRDRINNERFPDEEDKYRAVVTVCGETFGVSALCLDDDTYEDWCYLKMEGVDIRKERFRNE